AGIDTNKKHACNVCRSWAFSRGTNARGDFIACEPVVYSLRGSWWQCHPRNAGQGPMLAVVPVDRGSQRFQIMTRRLFAYPPPPIGLPGAPSGIRAAVASIDIRKLFAAPPLQHWPRRGEEKFPRW